MESEDYEEMIKNPEVKEFLDEMIQQPWFIAQADQLDAYMDDQGWSHEQKLDFVLHRMVVEGE